MTEIIKVCYTLDVNRRRAYDMLDLLNRINKDIVNEDIGNYYLPNGDTLYWEGGETESMVDVNVEIEEELFQYGRIDLGEGELLTLEQLEYLVNDTDSSEVLEANTPISLEEKLKANVTPKNLRDMVLTVNQYNGDLESYDWDYTENLDDRLEGLSPTRILDMAFFGSYRSHHEFFRFDGYGNLETFDIYELDEELEAAKDEIIEAWLGLPHSERAELEGGL